MSVQDDVGTIDPSQDWLRKAHGHAKKSGLERLTLRDINEIISDVRRKERKAPKAKDGVLSSWNAGQ